MVPPMSAYYDRLYWTWLYHIPGIFTSQDRGLLSSSSKILNASIWQITCFKTELRVSANLPRSGFSSLVGGFFTNPIEKHDSQIGSFPQGVKITNIRNHHLLSSLWSNHKRVADSSVFSSAFWSTLAHPELSWASTSSSGRLTYKNMPTYVCKHGDTQTKHHITLNY